MPIIKKHIPHLFITILNLLFLTACVEDPETTYHTNIINSSDHQIALSAYSSSNVEQRNIHLGEDEIYSERTSTHSKVDIYPFKFYSAVTIIYDDTLIVSYTYEDSLWYRNILLNDTWIREQDEYSFTYTYVFTNEDYEYALEQQ